MSDMPRARAIGNAVVIDRAPPGETVIFGEASAESAAWLATRINQALAEAFARGVAAEQKTVLKLLDGWHQMDTRAYAIAAAIRALPLPGEG